MPDRNKRKIYTAYPGGLWKAFTMSYDDGMDCDIRLCGLMRRYGVKGTFNVNSLHFRTPDSPPTSRPYRAMSAEEILACYGDDMEIAVHGATHAWWNLISPVNAMEDILQDKKNLEALTGRIIRGAAYPYGTYTDTVKDILRAADFRYCRTGRVTHSLELPEGDLMELPITAHHIDPEAEDLARELVGDSTGIPKLYLLFGHSFEFVQDDNWDRIERLLRIVGGRDDIWYATNLEIFDYLWAVRQLHYDAACTKAYNPTGTDVWLRICHKTRDASAPVLRIPAGCTAEIPD